MDKIKKCNKWLIGLLFLVVGFIIVKIINTSPQKALESLSETTKKSNDLVADQKEAEKKSKDHIERANRLKEEIENIEGDLEWHTKIKD